MTCIAPQENLSPAEDWPSLVHRFGYYDPKEAEEMGEEGAAIPLVILFCYVASCGREPETWWALPTALAFYAQQYPFMEAAVCRALSNSPDGRYLIGGTDISGSNERLHNALRTVAREHWKPLILHGSKTLRLAALRFVSELAP
ncbi:hypothetical protein BH11GEM2_BH11GEM2_25580 [soil metagenome]